MNLERYLPRAERRDALWLAGTLAGTGILLRLSHLPAFGASELWWRTPLLAALVYFAALVALLALARSAFHAPAAIAGVVVLSAATGLVGDLWFDLLQLAEAPFVPAILNRPPPSVPSTLAPLFPDLLVLLAAGLLYALLWAREQSRLAAEEDERGEVDVDASVVPAAVRRFAGELGLARGSEPEGRRLALWFVGLPFAVSLVRMPLMMPFDVIELRMLTAESTGIAFAVVSYGGAVLSILMLLGALYIAVRRFRGPRALWLPTTLGIGASLLLVPLTLLPWRAETPLASILASTLGYDAGLLLALWGVIALATRGPQPSESPADAEEQPPVALP